MNCNHVGSKYADRIEVRNCSQLRATQRCGLLSLVLRDMQMDRSAALPRLRLGPEKQIRRHEIGRDRTEHDPYPIPVMTVPAIVEVKLSLEGCLPDIGVEDRRITRFPSLCDPGFALRPIDFSYAFTEHRAAPHGDVASDHLVHWELIVSECRRPVRHAFHQ